MSLIDRAGSVAIDRATFEVENERISRTFATLAEEEAVYRRGWLRHATWIKSLGTGT